MAKAAAAEAGPAEAIIEARAHMGGHARGCCGGSWGKISHGYL